MEPVSQSQQTKQKIPNKEMANTNITDNELMQQISHGDERAFRTLFDRYFTPLSIFADKILNDTETATDIVQSLFVSLYEQRKEIKIISVKPFLYQSVRNRCLNEIKHQKIHENFAEIEYSTTNEETNNTEDAIEMSELEARLANAIKQLPSQCRKIFEMSRFEGKTNNEIAEKLNLSKRTVETQISKALASLRHKLGDLFTTISFIFLLS